MAEIVKYYIPGSMDLEYDRKNNKEIKKEGFIPNEEYNCYIVDDYGAFMSNTNEKEDINNSYYNDYKEDGYILVLGPSSDDEYKYGIFCKNYEDIASIEKINYTDFNKLVKNINVNEIIDKIKRKIIGQDNAIEAIVSNIYANQLILNTNDPDLIQTEKVSILVDGPTGTGKTAIMKEIAKEFSLPIVITSATRYSQTGYMGDSLDSVFKKLLKQANGDLLLAQRGIVCFDEIDKLGHIPENKYSNNMHEQVQEEILAYMSGEKINISTSDEFELLGFLDDEIEFDTSNITFVGMGAFTALRESKIKKIKDTIPTMGFNAPITKEAIEKAYAKLDKQYEITDKDYIDFGLKRELIGRFTLQTYTREYSVEDYKKILKESEISPLKQFIEFSKVLNIEEITYDEELIELIAKQAYDDKFGARGLQKIFSDLKNMLLIDMINSSTKTINLTKEMLEKTLIKK